MANPTPEHLRDAVRRLVVAHGTLNPAHRPCGTPLPTAWAWALLELAEGPRSVTQLARHLDIDRSNVSRLTARMEEAGEAERVRNPADRRSWLFALTEAGRRTAAGVDVASADHFRRVLSRLDPETDPPPSVVLDAVDALSRALRTPEAP